ncbi:unnamed protein product [Oikopleura dioica]|uniref:SCP domain-containing protein n=1 Tax=Oikopleura dioica TaxID=34765 RepID=E4XB70_OIKDI|nr:unnamed protein product [Oikopleura dioica]
MELMVWDQDLGIFGLKNCKNNMVLADAAQEWVESCECSALCEHGFSPDTSGRYGNKPWFHLGFNDEQRFGQNLYFSFLDNETATSDPIRQWHGEIRAYNYGSRTFLAPELGRKTDEQCRPGAICGHYTALVWSTSTNVGCGYHICEGMTNVNCHYGPPGNKGIMPVGIGRKPFRKGGQSCEDCASGHGWCDDGLCIDCPDGDCDCPIECKNCGILDEEECRCLCAPGWDGIACQRPCDNMEDTCGASPGVPLSMACSTDEYPRFPNFLCRHACEYCIKVDQATTVSSLCCGGKMCFNEGYLDEESCECICPFGGRPEDCKTEEMLTTKAPESEQKQDLTSNKGEKAEPIIQSSDDTEIQINEFREVTFSFGILIFIL